MNPAPNAMVILSYDARVRDWAYRNGEVSAVTGYIGVVRNGQTVGNTVKIIVADMTGVDGKATRAPGALSSVYLMSLSGITTADASVQQSADDDGSLLGIFNMDDSVWEVVEAMMATHRVAVMFSRKKGGPPVKVDLDLTVKATDQEGRQTQSTEMLLSYAICLKDLGR